MKRACLWAVAVAAAAMLAPAAPAAESPGVNEDIQAATAAYAEVDFEKALALVQQAERREGNSREQLVQIYHLAGLCLGALGRYEQAQEAFFKLLALEPGFRLGAEVAPRIRQPFEEMQKKNPPRIEVRAIPPAGAWKGEPVDLAFETVADPADMLRTVRIWYRSSGEREYKAIRFPLRGKGRHGVSLPPPLAEAKGNLEWYALAEGEYFSQLQRFGDGEHPFKLEIIERAKDEGVASKPWYKRWWVWAIAGGVVAAGAGTAAVLATRLGEKGANFNIDFSTRP